MAATGDACRAWTPATRRALLCRRSRVTQHRAGAKGRTLPAGLLPAAGQGQQPGARASISPLKAQVAAPVAMDHPSPLPPPAPALTQLLPAHSPPHHRSQFAPLPPSLACPHSSCCTLAFLPRSSSSSCCRGGRTRSWGGGGTPSRSPRRSRLGDRPQARTSYTAL